MRWADPLGNCPCMHKNVLQSAGTYPIYIGNVFPETHDNEFLYICLYTSGGGVLMIRDIILW